MNIKNLQANKTFDGDILLTLTVDKSEPVAEILERFRPNKF